MRPTLPSFQKLQPFLEQLDQSHVYSNYGPLSWSLRLKYSEYLNVSPDRIIPLANATLAIQGCLEILKQNNWLIPDYTFAATAHAAVSAKKSVLISDVRVDNFQLRAPEELCRDQFGAIPVMPFGSSINFEDWRGFDSLVIDAAASLGAPPPDFSLMPQDSMVVYSLHATKVLGAGEGALVVCENADIANRLRAWSNFGFDGERSASISGTNAKMSEYSCAVGLASIADLELERDAWNSPIHEIATLNYPTKYRTIVDEYPGFRPYWLIQLENLHEKELMQAHLENNDIESRSWWGTPISEMPAFVQLEKICETPNSKFLADTHLGLPIWKGITQSQLSYISKCLLEFK
jgi:dTDP-4-amino-4,6-dideoxygalactose transaminase